MVKWPDIKKRIDERVRANAAYHAVGRLLDWACIREYLPNDDVYGRTLREAETFCRQRRISDLKKLYEELNRLVAKERLKELKKPIPDFRSSV